MKGSDEIDEQVKRCHDTLFGPPGKPQDSLVIIVRNLERVSKNQARFGLWVLISFGGLIVREIWLLFTNA